MIPSCFHQRRYLLTACWRASTCWMGCLFSSSLLCLCIDFFLHPFLSLLCAFYDDSVSPRASPFDLLPLFISLCLPLISSHQFFFSFLPFSLPFSLLHRCQCSVSCGGGVQTRTIQCLRQGRPAAGCLPYQRPITSRACNTQFCPPAPPAPAQSPGRVVTAGGSTLKGKLI